MSVEDVHSGMSGDKLVHRGMGSDLMSLCGKVLGISGHDQVVLSYSDQQVTCIECLRVRILSLVPIVELEKLLVIAEDAGNRINIAMDLLRRCRKTISWAGDTRLNDEIATFLEQNK